MAERFAITEKSPDWEVKHNRYLDILEHTEANLDAGVWHIKAGRRVKKINPDGIEMDVPLSLSKRARMMFSIDQMRHYTHQAPRFVPASAFESWRTYPTQLSYKEKLLRGELK